MVQSLDEAVQLCFFFFFFWGAAVDGDQAAGLGFGTVRAQVGGGKLAAAIPGLQQ